MQVLALLLAASLVLGGEYGHESQSSGPHCTEKKDHQCHKIPKQEEKKECHVEYDIVEDVTYIEECEYVVTTHCEEDHEHVSHESHVVGHEKHIEHIEHHGGHHKREAAEHGHKGGHHSYSTGPKCHDKKDKQCHEMPKRESHKIPKTLCKTIVDTKYIEECEEIITTHCEETHEKKYHTTHVVGHDSYVEHKHEGHHH